LRIVAESRDRLLSGRYRLIEQIGRGGMGVVWWAYDEREEREVAVKEMHLPPSLGHRERLNLLRRTEREALAAGRLRHPGLIAMHELVIEDSRPWLVMEYVAARSLEDVFVDDGPISPRRVAEIGVQLLSALRAAHDAGIVHRDVKPSNVLLETSGRVVLTDFGIATYEGATTLTQTGTFMGSPAYVAPEVARGEPATRGSDLWSLGATLYAAVEGRPPYDFETAMATLSALVTSDPTPPQRAGELRPVLGGLLTKDPARRIGAERAAELLALAATPPARPAPAPPPWRPERRPEGRPEWRPERRPEWPERRRLAQRAVPFVTVGVLTLAVAAGVFAGVRNTPARYSGDQAPPSATPAASPSPTPPPSGPLPATLGSGSGAPVALLARGAATWPATSTLTLGLSGAPSRVSVVVTCPSAPHRLTFTAYAPGDARSAVHGTCGTAATTHELRLPAGTSPASVRVRVRPTAKAGQDPIDWYAGVYGSAR
jgi:eukaryotic-like serine/threonine-protein kinase